LLVLLLAFESQALSPCPCLLLTARMRLQKKQFLLGSKNFSFRNRRDVCRGEKSPPNSCSSSKQATHSLALQLFHVKQIFMLIFCVGNLCSNKSKIHYSILMILIANTSPALPPRNGKRGEHAELPMRQSKLNLCIRTRRSKVCSVKGKILLIINPSSVRS
jgi:hypothetical protein